ncbi:MAG: hypothetical protein EBR51_00645 [Gammaproteobacteria bacterium]|nr:hypothetical protein [Gammaproteobacteria bacterium]
MHVQRCRIGCRVQRESGIGDGDGDAREGRVRALGDEAPVAIHHHPAAVVFESDGADSGTMQIDRPTGFDRMYVQRNETNVGHRRERRRGASFGQARLARAGGAGRP